MSHLNYREESKKMNWGTTNGVIRQEDLDTGALLRIADALELIAEDKRTIENSRDYYYKQSEEKSRDLKKREYTIRALKGLITKLQKEIIKLKRLIA